MTRISDQTTIYFTADTIPTTAELAEIALIEGRVLLRNSRVPNIFGQDALEECDFVAGSVPTAYQIKDFYITNVGEITPAAPAQIAAFTPKALGTTTLFALWERPAANGAPITGYTVEYRAGSSGSWTNANHTGLSPQITISGLTAATQYEIRVVATNSEGNSTARVVTATTSSSGSVSVPSAVSNLTLATPTTTGGTLTWTLPNNGGAAITSQRIERSPAGENNWSILNNAIAGNATSFTDTTALASTAYDYRHRSTNAVGDSSYSNVITVTTASGTELANLEPPITTAQAANYYYAYGFDRQVEGYTGNTVRLQRLSDNAQEDFGFDASGRFEMAAVNTWRSGADVNVVQFYDQLGSARNLEAFNALAFVRSNVVKRFGCDYDIATDELTRSLTNGAVGCDLAASASLRLTGTTMDVATNGIKAILMHSYNTHKQGLLTNNPYNANNTREEIITIGTHSANRMRHEFNGTNGALVSLQINNVTAQTDAGSNIEVFKQNAQQITNVTLNATAFTETHGYMPSVNTNLSAANLTEYNAGRLDNPNVLIGRSYTNTSGSETTTNYGNFIFGALLLAKPNSLSAKEEYAAISKLNAIGQQHNAISEADLRGYFNELILLKDTNASTGVAAGENGLTTMVFATGGSVTNNLDYDDPQTGLNCVRLPDSANAANTYEASNTYFADRSTGSIVSFSTLENITGSMANALTKTIAVRPAGGSGGSSGRETLAIGYDHNRPSLWTLVDQTLDASGVTGSRRVYPASQAGLGHNSRNYVALGDNAGSAGGNQALGKYNRNTIHARVDFTTATQLTGDFGSEGSISYTFDSATKWLNEEPGQTLFFDAPQSLSTAKNVDNFQGQSRFNNPLLQIGTFVQPAAWNPANGDSEANRATYLSAVNTSYIAACSYPIGHQPGAVAVNNRAALTLAPSGHRLGNSSFQRPWEGEIFFWGFSNAALTFQQAERIAVNLYKLLV